MLFSMVNTVQPHRFMEEETMKIKITVALILFVSVLLTGTVFAEGEKALSQNCQAGISACLQKISALEKQIADLQAGLQQKPRAMYAQKLSGGPYDPRPDYVRDDYERSLCPPCDY